MTDFAFVFSQGGRQHSDRDRVLRRQQQRQGRRLVVLAIGAPTLVSQFILLVEVGVRPHFLAFWRRSLQVPQSQEGE